MRTRPPPPILPIMTKTRTRLFVAVAAAATALAALLIAANQLWAHKSSSTPVHAALLDARESASLLRGIPQHGTIVGEARAPVTLVEYADLQCPYCGEWARTTLPVL